MTNSLQILQGVHVINSHYGYNAAAYDDGFQRVYFVLHYSKK